MILLDANIVLRMCNKTDPDYARTKQAVFTLRKSEQLAIAPQTLYEFWTVATRNLSVNGLGMDRDRAGRWLDRYARLFVFLTEPPTLYDAWQRLVRSKDVKGFRAHDARYVALMLELGIEKLMTFNIKHYQGLPATLIDPHQVT